MLTVDKVLKLGKINSKQTVAKDIAPIFPKESILIRKNSLGTSGMCMGDSEMFIVRETLEMVGAELVR